MDCELHYINGTFYYLYALYEVKGAKLPPAPAGKAHHGVYYMRSKSGKIDGPWEDLGRLGVSQGSFFQDDDGSVYVCSGRFSLGKMKPDMTGGRDGELWTALPADGSHAFTDVGAYLRKFGRKYAYFSCGFGNESHWEPVAPVGDDPITGYNYSYMTADSPKGPWSRARMAVDYGGHGGVFRDAKGQWWAAFFGTDSQVDFRRHWWGPPGIVPLEVSEQNGDVTIRVARELPADYAAALAKKRTKRKSMKGTQ
jgi:beta-xylosidase